MPEHVEQHMQSGVDGGERVLVRRLVLCLAFLLAAHQVRAGTKSSIAGSVTTGQNAMVTSYHETGTRTVEHGLVTPLQWVFDTNTVGCLAQKCERIHENSRVRLGNVDAEDWSNTTHWFHIKPVRDEKWSLFKRGKVTFEHLAENPGRIYSTLYVYNGRVYLDDTIVPVACDPSVAAGRSSPGGGTMIHALVEVSLTNIAVGTLVDFTVSLRNVSARSAVIPEFFPDPVSLLAVDSETGALTSTRRASGCRDEIEQTWTLKPGETDVFVFSRLVGKDKNWHCLPLVPGEYDITIFDLAYYGFPTMCEPARLIVRAVKDEIPPAVSDPHQDRLPLLDDSGTR